MYLSYRPCRPYRPPSRSTKWKRGWLRACLRQRRKGFEEAWFLQNAQGKRRLPSYRAQVMFEEMTALVRRFQVRRVFAIEDVDGEPQWLIHDLWRLRKVEGKWLIEERDTIQPGRWGSCKTFPGVGLWPIQPDQKSKHLLEFRNALVWKLMNMAFHRANRRAVVKPSDWRISKETGRRKKFSKSDMLVKKILERYWSAPTSILCPRRLSGGHLAFRKAIWTHFLTRPVLHHWTAVHGVSYIKSRPAPPLSLEKLLKWQVPERDAIVLGWKEHAPNARPLMRLYDGELVSHQDVYRRLSENIRPVPRWDATRPKHGGLLDAFGHFLFEDEAVLRAFWESPSQMIAAAAAKGSLLGCVDYWHMSFKTRRLLEDLTIPMRAVLVAWLAERRPYEVVSAPGRPSRAVVRSRQFCRADPLPLSRAVTEGLVLEFRRQQMLDRPIKKRAISEKRRQPESVAALKKKLRDVTTAYNEIMNMPKAKRGPWNRVLARPHPWAVQGACEKLEKALPEAVPEASKRARF